MIDLKNIYFNEYIRVLFLLKLLPFLHLILTSYTYSDLGKTDKFSENKNNGGGLLDFKFYRSLAEQEYQGQYDYPNTNDNLLDEGYNNNEEYEIYSVSPYEQLSKRASNKVGVLQRNYKNRFRKKRGLGKLDHYFEKKVFDKLDDICELSKKMKHDKKSYKKKLLNKHGYKLISFCLLPLLGLIHYILYGDKSIGRGIIKYCGHEQHTNGDKIYCKGYMINNNKWRLVYMDYFNFAFTSIMIIIVLIIIIYILIKVIKYERIKAKKGKMCLKEYCSFCTDLTLKKS